MMQSKKSVSLILYLLSFSFTINVCATLQAISQGQSLIGDQLLVSQDGRFVLGFYKPAKPGNFYIGIWYGNLKQTVIWIANRDSPVHDINSSELKIAEDGNLVILDSSKIPLWSSNHTKSLVTKSFEAVLLDTGNFVLRDQKNSSLILWQCFDHPADTYIPGGWLGMNKITGEYQTLVSWKNNEDPASGLFTATIDPSGIDQFIFLWNKTHTYWKSGAWNGRIFTNIPEMAPSGNYHITFDDNSMWKRGSAAVTNISIITRMVMMANGQLKLLLWVEEIQHWTMYWTVPLLECSVYSICGPFGVCTENNDPVCSCPLGFIPASQRDWDRDDFSAGCQRITKLHCTGKDQFYEMPNMQLPTDPQQSLKVQNTEECKLACLQNCSCIAYAIVEASQCQIWYGNIRNLQQQSADGSTSQNFYLRVQGLEFHKDPNKGHKHGRLVLITAILVTVCLIFMFLTICLAWRRHRKSAAEDKGEPKGSLVLFTYADLRRATANFSEVLGAGSFGSVYKGTLKDSTLVAVKKLEGLKQGEKQFRAEVNTLGLIRHLNLVRLIGFCSEGTKKLLVYEFVSNGSLASFLSLKISLSLSWKARYEIIFGIARGLAYLHEECREYIIHCDIKPENILLDGDLSPKIADFGMAKLMGRDISRVLTTMRGTIGYLAPEWLSGLPITPKADVYSFGMMLFELVSGKRNAPTVNVTDTDYFPAWAARRTIEGDLLSLVDENIKDDVDTVELTRVCKVACWCIQDWEADRPSMSLVVKIMEGVIEMNMPPFPKSLRHAL